jgi:hypothetical protein
MKTPPRFSSYLIFEIKEESHVKFFSLEYEGMKLDMSHMFTSCDESGECRLDELLGFTSLQYLSERLDIPLLCG